MATAEKPIWFQSSREQLDALLLEVCDGLQLRPSRHELAVERYGTVNEILEKAGSPFRFLRPRIFPQGSMALGTTCKRSEEHTSELQSQSNLVCRLLLEKKNTSRSPTSLPWRSRTTVR